MRQHSGIGVLDKAVGVLHTIAESPCGLAELCERTGFPRATTYRLAAALEVHRLLARDDEGRWRLGPAADRTRRARQRSVAGGRRGGAAPVARDHRRKRAAVPPRGHVAGLRGRPGTVCGPSRYGPGRRAVADDGGLGGQSLAGPQRCRHAKRRAADGEVHRPDAGRSAPARLGAKRCRARAGGGQRVGAGARRPRRGRRRHLGVRDPSTGSAGAPVRAGPPTCCRPPTQWLAVCRLAPQASSVRPGRIATGALSAHRKVT